jgi:hypothetical protein
MMAMAMAMESRSLVRTSKEVVRKTRTRAKTKTRAKTRAKARARCTYVGV